MNPPVPLSYDRVAPWYDATRGWPPEVAVQIGAGLARLLAPAAQPPAPLRVVEVGAGSGRVLAPLAAQGAWATGVDVSPAMLRLLRGKAPGPAGGRLHAVLGDAHRLPFAAGRFDAGLLVHILHLVGDWPAVLEEVRRVVRPGGALAFGLDTRTPGEDSWVEPRWAALVAEAGGSPADSERHSATTAAVAQLAAAGYRVAEHILARWTAERTPAGILQRYRERLFSSSWRLPDTVLEAALARLAAELLARYRRLDAPLPADHAFRVILAVQPH